MEHAGRIVTRQGILAIIGMATIWTAVHNQLMYPITFTYAKAGAPAPITLYLAYAVLQLLTCAGIFAARRRVERALFSHPIFMAVLGALGIVGTVLLIVCDFASAASTLCVAVGVALFSLYVPTFFVFWATRLASLGDGTHAGGHTVALGVIASYVLFCLFTALRLLLDIHASIVGLVYPCVGTVLAVGVARFRGEAPGTASGTFAIKQLPLNVIVPSLAFVYLCAFLITLLNPVTSLSEHPPRRAVLYILDALLFVLVALIYLRSPNALKRCAMQTFAVLSIYLVGAVLLTGLGTIDAFNVGNFAAIAGKNAFDLFILLLVLVSVHNKHVQPAGPTVVYYAVALLVPHLISALLTSQGTLAPSPSTDGFYILTLIVVAAFLVSAAANVILIFFVARTPKGSFADADTLARPIEPTTFDQVQTAWNLSNREVEIVRLACTNASTSKISSSLCIAESTVYTHLKRIYRKAGVHSRQELVDLVETFKK